MLRGLLRGGALARGGGAFARGLRRPPLLHAAPPLHAAPSRGFRATPVGALASDLYERLGVARDASRSYRSDASAPTGVAVTPAGTSGGHQPSGPAPSHAAEQKVAPPVPPTLFLSSSGRQPVAGLP